MPAEPSRSALVEALLTLADHLEPQALAERLAAAGVEVLGAGAATVLILEGPTGKQILAGSDPGAYELAALEYRTGAGPGLECARSGTSLQASVEAGEPWPAWGEVAAAAGWNRVYAVPVHAGPLPGDRRTSGPGEPLDPLVVGALVMLLAAGTELAGGGIEWAQALAGVSAASLAHARARTTQGRLVRQLQEALTSRIVIEQAKGVLAERGGLDVGTAFDRLRRYSRAHRRRLVEVAALVVEGAAADDVLTHVGR